MSGKHKSVILSSFILLGLGILVSGCSTGVEESPNPGIVRVNIQADPNDTSIVVIGDTLTTTDKDVFRLTIFQGRVYQDSIFAILFQNTRTSRQQDNVYNIMRKQEGDYLNYTIFSSYVPPGNYDKLEFGLIGDTLRISNFRIPVQLPENTTPVLQFPLNFEVREDEITEINLMLSPLNSLRRFRDSYLFYRDVRVVSVNRQ